MLSSPTRENRLNTPKKELPLYLEAFNFYYKLGKERSFQKVQDQYKKSRSWVTKVHQTFRWSERVQELDKKQAEKELDVFSRESLIKSKQNDLKIIEAVKVRFAQQLSQDRTKISPADYEKLTKLGLLIQGDATERVDNLGHLRVDLSRVDDDTLKKLAEGSA